MEDSAQAKIEMWNSSSSSLLRPSPSPQTSPRAQDANQPVTKEEMEHVIAQEPDIRSEDNEKGDIVTFSKGIYYVKEGEDVVAQYRIYRFGKCDRSCIVRVFLEKGAKRKKLVDANKTIFFPKGCRCQIVALTLTNDDVWDCIEQCPIKLTIENPGKRPTSVAKCGETATIVITDGDKYPANTDPPKLKGFLKERMGDRGPKGVKTLLALAYIGVHSVIEAIILKIVIDTASKDYDDQDTDPKERRVQRFTLMAIIYILSFGVYYYANIVHKENRGHGGTKKFLRDKLMTKFMTLSEKGIADLPSGEFWDTLVFQVEELTKFGYIEALGFWKASISIIANMIFELYLVSQKIDPLGAVALCSGIPVIIVSAMALIYKIRNRKQRRMVQERQDAEDEWMQTAQELIYSREVMIRYHVNESALKSFRGAYEGFWRKNKDTSTYQMHTLFYPQWFFNAGLAAVFAMVPVLIRYVGFGAGDLAALIKSWLKLNSSCINAFSTNLNMAHAMTSLTKVADALNREDRIEERVNAEAIAKQATPFAEPRCLEDLDVIQFEDVSFWYGESMDRKVLEGASATISCSDGGFCLLSPGKDGMAGLGSGRRTVLRLLGMLVSPKKGRLTLPSFRKSVFVYRHPHVLAMTLKRNLTIGIKGHMQIDRAADKAERISSCGITNETEIHLASLCEYTARACGMSEYYCTHQDIEIGGSSLECLTSSDLVSLSLARAILSEAPLLLIDHLGDNLGVEYLESCIYKVLRAYVSGGLRAVLQDCNSKCPLDQLPAAPAMPPFVVWSSMCPPKIAHDEADFVLKLDKDTKKLEVAHEKARAKNTSWF